MTTCIYTLMWLLILSYMLVCTGVLLWIWILLDLKTICVESIHHLFVKCSSLEHT